MSAISNALLVRLALMLAAAGVCTLALAPAATAQDANHHMTEEALSAYSIAKDFAIPILAIVFSALISWLVARYSARQGAKLGAQAAAAFERERGSERVRRAQIRALHQSIFILSVQLNDLAVWWRHVRSYADDKAAWISLSAFEDIIAKDLVVPVEKLGFLWSESKGSAELLLDISRAQTQYEHTREAINDRSRYHRETLQPSVANIAQIRESETQEIGFDLNKLPWNIRERAERNTLNVFEHIAKSVGRHVQVIERLVGVAKQKFPDTMFARAHPPADVVEETGDYVQRLKSVHG
jgi:hypothetical protein